MYENKLQVGAQIRVGFLAEIFTPPARNSANKDLNVLLNVCLTGLFPRPRAVGLYHLRLTPKLGKRQSGFLREN